MNHMKKKVNSKIKVESYLNSLIFVRTIGNKKVTETDLSFLFGKDLSVYKKRQIQKKCGSFHNFISDVILFPNHTFKLFNLTVNDSMKKYLLSIANQIKLSTNI